MARQHPWYTPGHPASADDTWPLEDPYGEPGPGPAEQQDQQPAVPGPGSQGGGFVPAASYRMRRSPARPPAPRKARPARNTPLRPGRVLIAAALAGLAAGAGIAATASQPAIRLAPADNPAATSQYTPTIGPAATPSPAASSAPPTPNPSPSAGAAGPPAISTAAARRVLASYWAANNQANKARSDTLLARIEAGTSYQMDAGAYRTGRAAGPASGYTPVTAQNPVLWIPRQPAGTYPRWFAARVTYTGEGAGYLVFTQPQAGAPWKNVLEPYLLPRHRARTVRHHRRAAGTRRRRTRTPLAWPSPPPRSRRRPPPPSTAPRLQWETRGTWPTCATRRTSPRICSPARQPGTGTRPAGWCSPCRLSAAGRSCSTA